MTIRHGKAALFVTYSTFYTLEQFKVLYRAIKYNKDKCRQEKQKIKYLKSKLVQFKSRDIEDKTIQVLSL